MSEKYFVIYAEGESEPCGVMSLESALEFLPALKETGRDYYVQQITSKEASEIRKSITEKDFAQKSV